MSRWLRSGAEPAPEQAASQITRLGDVADDGVRDHRRMAGTTGSRTHIIDRHGFLERLETELLSHGSVPTLIVDIRDMRGLNDLYGYDGGDRIITSVARRLQASLAATDVVARLGGDEFAILAPSVGSDEDELALLEIAIEDRVSGEAIGVRGERAHVGVRIRTRMIRELTDLHRLI